jgi:hypothetical protein
MVAASTMLAATLAGLSPAEAVVVANQIQVPAGVATVQGAIDAAAPGDTVVVAAGTYHEHLDFEGKAIEVRSSAGPASTTIDGDGVSHVVRFHTNEGRASVLRGFTITHGLAAVTIVGGGVSIEFASPTIVDNVITANDGASHDGGGIGSVGGSPLIQGNHVLGNHNVPAGAGGGIFAVGAGVVIGNLIEDNSAGGGGGALLGDQTVFTDNVVRGNQALAYDGGGVSIGDGTPLVIQNLITANSAEVRGGGIFWRSTGAATQRRIVGNTVVGNQAPNGSAIAGESNGATLVDNVVVGAGASSTVECLGTAIPLTTFDHDDVFGGTPLYAGCADPTGADGNTSADPKFVAGTGPAPDYHLQPGSPSIDAGNSAAAAFDADIDGLPRITDGDGDGSAVVDMGAYEAPALAPKVARTPYTVWAQPTGTPLDGLGGWVYPFDDPSAADGQRAPAYFYAHYFGFASGGAVGQVGLVTNPAGKFAVFSVVESNGTTHDLSVPFPWSANRFYFPLVYQVGPGLWGAWVYDNEAAAWTQIGVHALPPAWGKLAPASITAVAWVGPTAGNCSAYPRADVADYAPFGFVGGAGSVASATTTGAGVGDCPPEGSVQGPWAHYRTGADAFAPPA